MPMTPAAMAAAITAAQGPAEDPSIQDAANLKLATGIINHIEAAALVSVTTAMTTGSVTTGPGAGGVVTGPATGTGTIS